MNKIIDAQINDIKNTVTQMIDETIELYKRVKEIVIVADVEISKQIIKDDEQINVLEAELSNKIIEYIVSQSPVASDLRVGIASLKIASEIERIADYTTNIAKVIRRGVIYEEANAQKINTGIDIVIEMLSELDELLNGNDVGHGYELAKKDDLLDELYHNYYLFSIINQSEMVNMEQTFSTIVVLKHLERAGDHIVNIIEDIIYSNKGKRVSL